jgi:prophage regulatory protein
MGDNPSGLADNLLAHKSIRMVDVLRIVPVTRQTLYRWIEEGTFPKPIKLGPSSIGFREFEVVAWLRTRPRVQVGDGEVGNPS